MAMAGRGRGRGFNLASPPSSTAESKPKLHVSRGRAIQKTDQIPGLSRQENFELTTNTVVKTLDKHQSALEAGAAVKELMNMMEKCRNGPKVACETVMSTIFSEEYLCNPIPDEYIVNVLAEMEGKIVVQLSTRDILFTALQKMFNDRAVLRNKGHLQHHEMAVLILVGLTKKLKTPEGLPYVPLLKATITWIIEMLQDNADQICDIGAQQLHSVQDMVNEHENLIEAGLIKDLYLCCRKVILNSNKFTKKRLMSCLERHLTKRPLQKEVADVYA